MGYNSLVELIKLPLDYLKIDKSFVDGITDEMNYLIIKTLITFAHGIGKRVTAEGVENKEQLDILKSLGCDYIQGYYFSRPLPPDKLRDYVLNAAMN